MKPLEILRMMVSVIPIISLSQLPGKRLPQHRLRHRLRPRFEASATSRSTASERANRASTRRTISCHTSEGTLVRVGDL
jgi:hypothetical protein